MAKKQNGIPKEDLQEPEVTDPHEEEDETQETDESSEESKQRKSGKTSVSPKRNNGGGRSSKKGQKDVVPVDERERTPSVDNKKRKKVLLIASIAAAIALIVAAGIGYRVFGPEKTDQSPTGSGNANVSGIQLIPRRIDGVLDTPDHQNPFPVAVMVENHPDARPQSGLDHANIIYEALAEGGITRFMAIFTLTDDVPKIGPVRSARPYYVDWARAYDALYVHVGGSPKGLERLVTTHTRDFNQFYNPSYFFRDKNVKVASEHTMYTTGHSLLRALGDQKLPSLGDYQPWKYKDDAAIGARPASQHVTITFSTFSYKVDYEYDPVRNVYIRSLAEKPHVMRDGTQISPKNVVVLTVNRSLEDPKDSHGRLKIDTIGEGPAQFFLDGTVVKGTWKKTSSADPLQLVRDDGTEMTLNAGQTWVEVVPPDQTVTVR